MFILQFIPDFVFHLMLLISIAGLAASIFLKFIPFVAQYLFPIQVISSILLVFSIFMEGAISNNHTWEARVAELKAQVVKAEAESADANAKLKEALSAADAKITEAQAVTKKSIEQNAANINKECRVNDISLQLYNQAVRGNIK